MHSTPSALGSFVGHTNIVIGGLQVKLRFALRNQIIIINIPSQKWIIIMVFFLKYCQKWFFPTPRFYKLLYFWIRPTTLYVLQGYSCVTQLDFRVPRPLDSLYSGQNGSLLTPPKPPGFHSFHLSLVCFIKQYFIDLKFPKTDIPAVFGHMHPFWNYKIAHLMGHKQHS